MMYAYDEMYLEDAMRNLGEAFDYSVTVLHISMDDFLDMFIISGIAEQFARGVPKFLHHKRYMTIPLSIGAVGFLRFINGISEKVSRKSKNICL